MPSQTRRYEIKVQRLLKEYFDDLGENVEVTIEWSAFRGEGINKYSPRVDVAVGPFAYRRERYIGDYDRLTNASHDFLNNLLHLFKENSQNSSFTQDIPDDCDRLRNLNRNAECFIAIEIEKSRDRKHSLGDIVNACSLGRVGLIIAWAREALKSFLKIVEYFAFLRGVEKPTYKTRNLVVLWKKQFDTCISRFSARGNLFH